MLGMVAMPKEHNHFAPPATAELAQKDHEFGIQVVFDDMRREGYEIESVNTDQTKHPQIVATRKGFTVFVSVVTRRGDLPELPQDIRQQLLERAKRFEATCFFAPVGLWATGQRNESGDEGFYIKYVGMKSL